VVPRHALAVVAFVAAIASGACSTLLSEEPTPVPGAAATLTRSINTPIPTPVRAPLASPSPNASPVRVAVAASTSPFASQPAGSQTLGSADVAQLQTRMQQTLAAPGLTGIEDLLLDHISLSTQQGGSVMDAPQAASWLREHAAPGITVSKVDSGTQDVMLQVLTDGWPHKDPIQAGQVTFSLRRYDANGRQDQTGGGDWKIDVIEAD
jgi:hypothetical protein